MCEMEKVSELIENEVESGELSLDKQRLTEIKQLCKTSEDCLKRAFHLLMKRLTEEHSQVRWSCFLIVIELFERSHLFRELLIENLNQYLLLVSEIDHLHPMPPPKAVAMRLKEQSVFKLKAWVNKYGESYKKLSLAFHFLLETGKIKIPHQQENSSMSAQSAPAIPSSLDKRRVKMVESEILSRREELLTLLIELENLYEILVPNPTSNNSKGASEELVDDLRHHGLMNSTSVNVILCPRSLRLVRSSDNEDICMKLQENAMLIAQSLPNITRWLTALSRSAGDNHLIQSCIDLKTRVEIDLRKAAMLGIDFSPQKRKSFENNESGSEDDEFEEVPELDKKDLNLSLTVNTKEKCYPKEVEIEELKPGSSKRERQLAEAPVIPFGADLEEWGKNRSLTASCFQSGFDSLHFYWKAPEVVEGFSNPELVGSLRTRVIPFVGNFEPVNRSCRAPRPNGSLCPRKDRVRCPFHGVIVPRDESGVPAREEDRIKEKKMKEKAEAEKIPDWQEPEYLRDLQAATGIDFKVEKQKKRKKSTNLTDISKISDTPRTRLEKKILGKSALKRVGLQLDEEQRKRVAENFAHNWNYSINQ